MTLFQKLSISVKIAVLTYIITLICFLATIYLFFINMMDVPLGILLGGFIAGSLSLISRLLEKKDEQKESALYSIIFIIIRFVVLIGLTVVIALMNYLWGLKIFNVFSFVGGYSISVIVMVIVYLKNK